MGQLRERAAALKKNNKSLREEIMPENCGCSEGKPCNCSNCACNPCGCKEGCKKIRRRRRRRPDQRQNQGWDQNVNRMNNWQGNCGKELCNFKQTIVKFWK